MAENATSCAHCGKEGEGFKRCSICKQTWYCGAECQKAGWKKHKKGCAPPVPLNDVIAKVNAALDASDCEGVIKWEGRMEEMMAFQSDDNKERILLRFSQAHRMLGHASTGRNHHLLPHVQLEERRIEVLGSLQRFRDQGEAMCENANRKRFLADTCADGGADSKETRALARQQEAKRCFERARDVGAAHGFFSVECRACMGLGAIAMQEGRNEEGLALLQNALAASRLQLTTLDDATFEMGETLHPKPCNPNPKP